MISIRALVLTGAALLLGVSMTTAQQRQALPRFEPADCQFNDDYFNVTCGDLHVPEDRSNPDSIEIWLHVAIFPSTSSSPAPDPVVYLEGGPGGDALYFIEYSYPVLVAPLLEKRDVILFDQRGTGFSFPKLDCPEFSNMQYDILDENLPPDENVRLSIEALNVCRARLESRGYNLAAYNSAENAADLADLRVALGYDSWNLYGISYGTRLALTAMRDHPEGIRSVVIDSVLPPQVSLFDEIAANADRAFNTLFLNCTLDPVCNASYPYLGTIFAETVTRLNSEAALMYINHPLTGREYEVRVDGNRLVALTFHALYSVDLIPLLPKIIYEAYNGNYNMLARTMESYLREQAGFSLGMHYSVQCREETPFTTIDSAVQSAAAYTLASGFVGDNRLMFTVCAEWTNGSTPNPVESLPVFSDIPTLVMGGEYDPITPPHWALMAAGTLPNSHYYEIPSVGHGVTLSHPCAGDIMRQFLDNPSQRPNDSCIAQIQPLEWVVVDNSIALVPFVESEQGIAGVRPENWAEMAPGMFIRDDMNNEAMLAYLVIPSTDSQYVLRTIAQEFQIYVTPDAIDSHPANGFIWQVHEFRYGENIVTVGLAQRGTDTYAVLLLSQRFERDDMYRIVFIPALDNFQQG